MDCKWCGSSTQNASYDGLKKGVFCCRRCELEWRKENPEDARAAEEEVLAELTRGIAKMRDPAYITYSEPLGKEYSRCSFVIGFLLGALQVFLITSVAFLVIGILGESV